MLYFRLSKYPNFQLCDTALLAYRESQIDKLFKFSLSRMLTSPCAFMKLLKR